MKKLPLTQALFILAVAAIALFSIIRNPLPIGFTVLEKAEVFAGKDTYYAGDMAHIFVTPTSADYTLEVYGPEGSLYAVSTDFPVNKAGTYTIKAILKEGNLTNEIHGEFSVINKEPVQETGDSETIAANLSASANESVSDVSAGIQIVSEVNGTIKDSNNNDVGKKIEDEQTFETFFNFVGKVDDKFVISFYHNSTTAQPVWIEGYLDYSLSALSARPYETVNLTIPLKNNTKIPKFRLHVGLESEVFEFDIEIVLNVEDGSAGDELDLNRVQGLISEDIKQKDIEFTKDDVREEIIYDENNNAIKSIKIEKEGIKIKINGADRNKINNSWFRNGVLHMDSVSIKNATIRIPYPQPKGITIAPKLYIKEDAETVFREAEPYCLNKTVESKKTVRAECDNNKDPLCLSSGGTKEEAVYTAIPDKTRCFNTITTTPTYYEFSVEHFSDYYVNSTGGNYLTLTDCLFAINNTANTCSINEGGTWAINNSYMFFIGDNAIELNTGNIVLDCNGTIIKGNKTGNGVSHVRSGTNLTVRNCHMQDFNYGFNLDGYQHENITTYNISTNGSSNVFQYGNQNVTDAWFNETDGTYGLTALDAYERIHRYNNIHMTVRNNTYGFFLDQVDGGFFSNFTIEATDTETCVYFSNYPNTNTLTNFTINCGGMIGIDTREGTFNTIRDSNITNTSIAIIVQSGSNTIANNTIQESGNSTTVNFFKVSGSWYSFGGNDFNQTTPRLYNTALSAFVSIDSNDKDVSSIADGTNNFSLWLMDLTAVSLPFITLYIEQPNSLSCAAVAGAYGGTCYLDAQDYFGENGNANYSVNTTTGATIITGSQDPAYLRFQQAMMQITAPFIIIGANNNITGNTFYNHSTGVGLNTSINLTGGSNKVWLNNFYYGGVEDTGSENTYCVNNEGNFYAESIAYGSIGNGTGESDSTIGGDCGPANLTMPSGQIFTGPDIILNWTGQSSMNNVSYHLFYRNASLNTWNYIDRTEDITYTWDVTSFDNGNFYVKIVPFDNSFNATNDTTPLFQVISIFMTLINQTRNETGTPAIVNATEAIRGNENLTIKANITYLSGQISTVWIKVWQTVKEAATVVWEGLLSLISGTTSDGIWSTNISINGSFTRTDVYNYTIYANDTANFTMQLEGNFSVWLKANKVCSDPFDCEYNNLTGALTGENNTNSTITLLDSNTAHSITANLKFNIAPPSPVISINASNVTLDCNGAEFIGNGTGTGIMISDHDLVTIRECNLTNYESGIIVHNSTNSNITLNTIRNTTGYDLNITPTSNHSQVSSNSFYGKNVISGGEANIFCRNGDPALDKDSSILLAYNFQEQNGTTTEDKSGNDYDGTFYPSEASGPLRKIGKYSKSLEFDGTDDYINSSATLNFTTSTNFTVELWFKTNSSSSQTIIGYNNSASADVLRINTVSGFVNAAVGGGNGTVTSLGTSTVNDNNFHYITLLKSTFVRLYVDGSSQDNDSYPYGNISLNDILIGALDLNGVATSFFNGTIDSVVIYNRSLSQTEILLHFLRGRGTGNFYVESSNRSNIEFNLDDCGISELIHPTGSMNYTGTLQINWTGQTSNTGTTTYYLDYSNDSGTNWYAITSTALGYYSWGISGLPDGDEYKIRIKPSDGRFNATNATSGIFGVHNSPPQILFLNQTNTSNIPINETNPTRSSETVVVAVNVSGKYSIDSVWIDIWNTTVGSVIVWEGTFSLVQGTVFNGTWTLSMAVNESFPESGFVNYSINANGSLNNSNNHNGNISILDNELLCANSTLCEYQYLGDALAGEDNSNNSIQVLDANSSHSGGSGLFYAIYPPTGTGAIKLNASNITIDCQGSTISGGYRGYGLSSNGLNNLTLKDCRFGRYQSGINMTNSSGSNISGISSFNNLLYGLFIESFNDGSIKNVNLSNNTAENLLMINSNRNLLDVINASYSSSAGINLTNSSNNTMNRINSVTNTKEALFISSLSERISISNSTFSDSTSASLVSMYGDNANIAANTFSDSPSGFYDLAIATGASTTSVWLNNFYTNGVVDNGTGTLFCFNIETNLQNSIFSTTSTTEAVGNYYSSSVNTISALKGSCGYLSVPYGDLDGDSYYSITHDCSDDNIFAYPFAAENCDDFDNDCDGTVDEGACVAERFPSAGTGTSGGAPMIGFSIEKAEKEQNISQNPVVIMYKGDVVSFTIKGEKRSLRLDKLYFDKANLSILSANENFIMFVNDSRMLDLDGDGIDDLTIILSSIGGAAVFHLQEITIGVAEEVSITPEEVIKPGEEKPSEEERPPVEEKPSIIFDIGKKALKYIGLAAVAMAIMISLVLGALSYSNFIGNVSKAENYVRDALVRGVPKATIKRKMTEAGWEDQVVDSILKMESQIMTRKDLERKITEAVKEGLSREEIKKSLIEKGWKESDVERLLK